MSASNYRKGLRNSVRGLWSGVLDASQFQQGMTTTIERWLTVAWRDGAAECGIGSEEFTVEEHRALLAAIDSELGHIGNFASAIQQNSRANDGKLAPLLSRTDKWVNRYKDLQNRAKTMACGDKKLEWRLGATEEHCSTCNKLHGKVKRASQWRESGLQPQNPPNDALECGGWMCLCTLRVTDKPVSKGRLPKVAALALPAVLPEPGERPDPEQTQPETAVVIDENYSRICSRCKHWNPRLYRSCAAFPREGTIPRVIWTGANNHQAPYPGDNGIQFEPKITEEE